MVYKSGHVSLQSKNVLKFLPQSSLASPKKDAKVKNETTVPTVPNIKYIGK